MDVFDVAWKFAAAGVSVSIGLLVIKELAPQIRGVVILVFAGIALGVMVGLMAKVVTSMYDLARDVPILDSTFGILVKAIGVAYAVELAASICSDCGESAIATKIQMVGRLVLTMITLPLILMLVKQLLNIVNKATG